MTPTVLFSLLIPALLGYMTATAVLGKETGRIERIAVSYPIGSVITAIVLFTEGSLHIPFSQTAALAGTAIAALPITVYLMLKARTASSTTTVGPSFKDLPTYQKTAAVFLLAWITFKISLLYATTFTVPVWSVDSIMNWTARAQFFYYDRGIYLHPEDFFLKSVGQTAYPPYSPMTQVWTALLDGTFNKIHVKAWAPGFMLSFALMTYAFVRRYQSIPASLLAVVLAISAPLITLHATEPYADFPVGVSYAIALIYFWKYLESPEPRYAVMTGIGLTTALFIKMEAMVFALLTLSSCLPYLFHLRKKARQWPLKHATALLAPFLVLTPYFFFRAWYHIGFKIVYSEPVTEGLVPLRQINVLPLIVNFMLLPDNINIIATIGLPALLLLHLKRHIPVTPALLHVVLPVIAYLLFFLFLYTFSAPHKVFLETGTIFNRNAITAYPSLLLATFLLARNLWNPKNADVPQKKV